MTREARVLHVVAAALLGPITCVSAKGILQHDGCPANAASRVELGSECVPGDGFHAAAVRCCRNSDASCISVCPSHHVGTPRKRATERPLTALKDTKAALYAEAAAECAAHGRRLCTANELANKSRCCGTGCAMDNVLVWTSDSCSADEMATSATMCRRVVKALFQDVPTSTRPPILNGAQEFAVLSLLAHIGLLLPQSERSSSLVYVDLAANDARFGSNTFVLDHCFGSRGVCVEPNPRYHLGLQRLRSCALEPTCVSYGSKQEMLVTFNFEGQWGSVVGKRAGGKGGPALRNRTQPRLKADAHNNGEGAGVEVQLQCQTLKEILERHNVQEVHYLALECAFLPRTSVSSDRVPSHISLNAHAEHARPAAARAWTRDPDLTSTPPHTPPPPPLI